MTLSTGNAPVATGTAWDSNKRSRTSEESPAASAPEKKSQNEPQSAKFVSHIDMLLTLHCCVNGNCKCIYVQELFFCYAQRAFTTFDGELKCIGLYDYKDEAEIAYSTVREHLQAWTAGPKKDMSVTASWQAALKAAATKLSAHAADSLH
jgi:hypothetical protein